MRLQSSLVTAFRSTLAFATVLAAAPLAAIDGLPDPTFGTNGRARIPFDLGGNWYDVGSAVALDAEGRIVVVGDVANGAFGFDCGVARLLPSGGLDPTFDGDGRLSHDVVANAGNDNYCSDVAIGPGGEIYAAGIDADGRLWFHLFPSGSGHGSLPTPHDGPPQIAVDAGGNILLAWSDGDFHICRHLGSGWSLDPTFGIAGCATVAFDLGGGLHDLLFDITLQPDGKILLVGAVEWGDPDYDFGVARLTPNGSLDAGFGAGGKLAIAFDLAGWTDIARAVAAAENGRIVLAGSAADSAASTYSAVASVASDGSFFSTTSYLAGGTSSMVATGVAVQDDARIVFAGWGVTGGDTSFAIARLHPDLSWDAGFDGGLHEFDPDNGGFDGSSDLVLQGGRAIAVGWAEWADPDYDFAVMRFGATLIFADGFERGSTGHWSSATP